MAKNQLSKYNQYATDVISGKKPSCKWERLACERYFNDIKNSKEFYFDTQQAEIRINFIQLLSFSKKEWAGKPFLLEPWEQFIIANIFGWRKVKDGTRRFEDATINIPKKNGKTELAAAIAITVSYVDKMINGEVYMAATAREQAGICLKAAKDMIKLSAAVNPVFEVLAHHIVVKGTGTFIKAVSSEASTAEGKGASCVILDEEHEQKTNLLRDNLKSGMAASANPLFISISTAGTNRTSPYYAHIKTCKEILEGVKSDENHFIIIYGTDENDNWEDPEVWVKANPNYNISVKGDFLKKQHVNTINEPSTQPNFKTKHLNIWTDTYTTWIAHEIWMKGAQEINIEDYYGRECWCGLDLASSMDFTALSILIPDGDKFILFWKFWIPEVMAEKRSVADKLKFTEWARNGFITLTEGNVTDYDIVQRDIIELNDNMSITKIGYDEHNASQLVTNLTNNNVLMEPFSQSMMNMSAPIKEFERTVMVNGIIHDGNPVMAWMLSNVLIKRDGNDNKRIDRGSSTDKVDGAVATIDALGVYRRDIMNGDVYFIA